MSRTASAGCHSMVTVGVTVGGTLGLCLVAVLTLGSRGFDTGTRDRRCGLCRVVWDLDFDAEAAAGGAPNRRVSPGAGGGPPDDVQPEAGAGALWHWCCCLRAIRGALIFNHQRPRLGPSRGPAQLHAKGCSFRGVGEDI